MTAMRLTSPAERGLPRNQQLWSAAELSLRVWSGQKKTITVMTLTSPAERGLPRSQQLWTAVEQASQDEAHRGSFASSFWASLSTNKNIINNSFCFISKL
jgi:hypothetical protein